MSFNWVDYIQLAYKLLNGKDEACYRSAISRAYYGVFCIARDKIGYQEYKRSDVHSKVIDVYTSSNDEDERLIGWFLNDLRKARNVADYKTNGKITRNNAKIMIDSAKSILDILGIQYDDFRNNGGKK
jgi:uncharacterized protein (UPF0332 family)